MELAEKQKMFKELRRLPMAVQRVLDVEDKIKRISERIASYENVFFIGRGISFPVALEGALKLKEISYIHAEGYAAGELKHGPFALLTEKTPVVAIVARDRTYDIMLGNIKEVKARNAPVVAVADEDDDEIEKYVDFVSYSRLKTGACPARDAVPVIEPIRTADRTPHGLEHWQAAPAHENIHQTHIKTSALPRQGLPCGRSVIRTPHVEAIFSASRTPWRCSFLHIMRRGRGAAR